MRLQGDTSVARDDPKGCQSWSIGFPNQYWGQ